MDNIQEIFTIPESADAWRVKEPTVRSWVLNEKIPVVRMGRRVFIRKEVIEKVLQEGLEAVNTNNN